MSDKNVKVEDKEEKKLKYDRDAYKADCDKITEDFVIEKLRLIKEIEAAQVKLRKVKADRDKFEEEKQRVSDTVQELKKELTEKQTELNYIKTAMGVENTTFSRIVQEHEIEVKKMSGQEEDLRKAVKQAEKDIEEIIKQRSDAALALLEQVEQAHEEKEKLNDLLESKRRVLVDLNKNNDALCQEQQVLEDLKETTAEKVSTVKKELESVSEELKSLQQKLTSSRIELEKNRKDLQPILEVQNEVDRKLKEVEVRENAVLRKWQMISDKERRIEKMLKKE
jgi:chromosome segregation protein